MISFITAVEINVHDFSTTVNARTNEQNNAQGNKHNGTCIRLHIPADTCEHYIMFGWAKLSIKYYRFSRLVLSTKFISWAFNLKDLGHAQPIRHSILFSQHSILHWRHSNLNLCRSNSRKLQQVRKTVIQFRRCPDRWRIWMLSSPILIWMMWTLNFLTEVRIWMTEIQIWTTNFMAQIYFANFNDSFIKWNDKFAKLTGKTYIIWGVTTYPRCCNNLPRPWGKLLQFFDFAYYVISQGY